MEAGSGVVVGVQVDVPEMQPLSECAVSKDAIVRSNVSPGAIPKPVAVVPPGDVTLQFSCAGSDTGVPVLLLQPFVTVPLFSVILQLTNGTVAADQPLTCKSKKWFESKVPA